MGNSELFKMLGNINDSVWNAYVRYYIAYGVSIVIAAVLLASLSMFVGLRLSKRNPDGRLKYMPLKEDEFYRVVTYFMLLVSIVLAGVILAFGIQMILAPQYFAIKDVLDLP